MYLSLVVVRLVIFDKEFNHNGSKNLEFNQNGQIWGKNAAFFKYIQAFAVELGNDKVTMIGWDDKAGIAVGEHEQPTAATQNPGKSWMHSEQTVGEGQHSFHKTNLTPSVRLIHELRRTWMEVFTGSWV